MKKKVDSIEEFEDAKEAMGKRIKQLRKAKGESQKELAEHLLFSQNTLSKIENGSIALTLENLIKFTEYFNVSFDYICKGSNNSTILDILTKYIKITYTPAKDYQSAYPELKINSALINYLFMKDIATSLYPKPDIQEKLLSSEEDTFYAQTKDKDTLTYLSIPLTKDIIFPDDYQKEWSQIINIRNVLSNKQSESK